jgi:hypothetical protein
MMTTMPHRALLLLSLILAVPAMAQNADVTGTDRAAISACLRESLTSPGACIGSIAVVCARAGRQGDRREIETACARREMAVWRERLDASSAAYAQRLESGARSRFVALQRTWETYVTQKCAFLGDQQPPAQALTMQTGCGLREIAMRANEVERQLRGGATARGTAPRSPSQPPAIIR